MKEGVCNECKNRDHRHPVEEKERERLIACFTCVMLSEPGRFLLDFRDTSGNKEQDRKTRLDNRPVHFSFLGFASSWSPSSWNILWVSMFFPPHFLCIWFYLASAASHSLSHMMQGNASFSLLPLLLLESNRPLNSSFDREMYLPWISKESSPSVCLSI